MVAFDLCVLRLSPMVLPLEAATCAGSRVQAMRDSLVETLGKALTERPEVELALLFGSRARGNQREDSDVDRESFNLFRNHVSKQKKSPRRNDGSRSSSR